ncbi:MAG: type II toxin-antitoxin system VapC family toxin [Candidatus Bathycorpusculaceae bacterium]
MRIYVLDASVASRFLLVEDLSDKAELVLDGFLKGKLDLKAPRLLVYEVGNTLWKSVKGSFMSLEEAGEKFSYFLELRIDSIRLSGAEHREVLEWGVKNNATYYDSVYVKSCMKVGGTLLTADDILYKMARETVPTVHLKDYQG